VTAFILGNVYVWGDEVAPAPSKPPALSVDSAEVKSTLPLFYRLNETLFRGGQPLRGGLGALKRLGVNAVVDLRSIYDHTDEIGVTAERIGLRYYWLPMSVWNPPTDQEAREFLSVVTDDSKGPFFVFCADGVNRTGELSAIYRIARDKWSVEQAIEEMDRLGFNPYYYALRAYVWTYARKHHPKSLPAAGRRVSAFE
jgi:protein tyrosine phosphatase (PTP) superfamily phosphohydrolase (DUF442 family)